MGESNQGAHDPNDTSKQPFVSQGDRPDVRLTPDMPLSELRVRDLTAILGVMVGKNPNFEVGKTGLKDFFDKPFPEQAKDIKEFKPEKLEKSEIKEFKGEKNEKFEKNEKLEKSEIKEAKSEKLETGEPGFDPRNVIGPDPRMEQLIQTMTGLTTQVSKLANQVEELQKRRED